MSCLLMHGSFHLDSEETIYQRYALMCNDSKRVVQKVVYKHMTQHFLLQDFSASWLLQTNLINKRYGYINLRLFLKKTVSTTHLMISTLLILTVCRTRVTY